MHSPYKFIYIGERCSLNLYHSQLNGQELNGLTLEELQKLEEQLKRGVTNVSKAKVRSLLC